MRGRGEKRKEEKRREKKRKEKKRKRKRVEWIGMLGVDQMWWVR